MEKTEYGGPSLALKMGHTLRKCVSFLRGQALRNGFIDENKKYKSFLKLLEMEWAARVTFDKRSVKVE